MNAARMHLDRSYDKMNRETCWKVLTPLSVHGRLLNAVRSIYDGSNACVRVSSGMSK